MKKELTFSYPFSYFDSLSFLNCFASTYMYLEGITGKDEYICLQNEGKECDRCGNCRNTTFYLQETYYFLFGTLSGTTAFRPDFDGLLKQRAGGSEYEKPETIDIVFKIVGYDYEIITDNLMRKIMSSIDNGMPVLAKMKNDDFRDTYRIIIGYDDEKLTISGAAPLTSDSFSSVIIINKKVEPQFTFLDSLKLIQTKMKNNEEMGIWDGYIQKFKYWDEKLQDMDLSEIKKRFDRMEQIMYCNFNTNNFMEAFCRRVWEPTKDERLSDIIDKINDTYSLFHDRSWQLQALNVNRDWSVRRTGEPDWAYCGCVIQTLESLKEYDKTVSDEIDKAIEILTIKTN